MSYKTFTISKCDAFPELIGKSYVADVTQESISNEVTLFGDIKQGVYVVRFRGLTPFQSGEIKMGKMIYRVIHKTEFMNNTSLYVVEYRDI